MALKDWKIKFESDGQILWRNIKTNNYIQINEYYDEGWYFFILGKKFSKPFKTKSQALRYAKKFMRSH